MASQQRAGVGPASCLGGPPGANFRLREKSHSFPSSAPSHPPPPKEAPFLSASTGSGFWVLQGFWSPAEVNSRLPKVAGLATSAPSHVPPKTGKGLMLSTWSASAEWPSQIRLGRMPCRRLLQGQSLRGGAYLFVWQTP